MASAITYHTLADMRGLVTTSVYAPANTLYSTSRHDPARVYLDSSTMQRGRYVLPSLEEL